MWGLALRGAVVAVTTAVGLTGVAAAPAVADAAALTALSPAYGPVGTVVDITGTGLSTTSDVTFNGVDAGVPSFPDPAATDTHIRVTVPDGATTGPVVVTTADGSPSLPFTVQQPTVATVARSRRLIDFRDTARITAVLTTAAGQPVSGQPAHLQRTAPHTSDWVAARRAKSTTSHGRVHWSVSPRAGTCYRVVFDDVPAYRGTRTGRTRVNVTPLVALHVPDIAPILTKTTFRGRVRPTPHPRGEVRLQQRVDGTWHHVDTRRTDRYGRFRFVVTLPETGRYAYRVWRPHDSGHHDALSGVCRIQAVERTLRSGMSGADVTALQRRLKVLRYDVGGVTGTFGFDTQHAVVAFEKVQGLDRDGVVGLRVWTALEDPKVPRLQHPEDATDAGVEVDLTHQVIYYARNGEVRRILDSSTGGGYYYTGSDGTQQRAVTPTGHFSIVYKREGWVHAPLGELYRPAYFNNQGYAIHGETEVPPYPASHGCVRITVPAMDRMNSRLPVGLSVWIY